MPNPKQNSIAEDRLQQQMYMSFHNKYKHLRGCLCYNLNNSKNKIDGLKNKGMGLQAGRADMVLYYNKKAYMIEVKLPNKYQQPVQKIWQAKVEAQGFEYVVVKSVESFNNLMAKIIN